VRNNLARGGVLGVPGLIGNDLDKPQRGEVNLNYYAALRLDLLLGWFQGLQRFRPWLDSYAPSVLETKLSPIRAKKVLLEST
jgi:hypothetical protein